MTGVVGDTFLIKTYHFESMLNNMLGTNFTHVGNDKLESLKKSQKVNHMTHWPTEGSIKVIDDIIVVKLSE